MPTQLVTDAVMATAMVMRVSPDLCLYSKLLALPLAALDEAVENEVEVNPALVRSFARRCRGCGRRLRFGTCRCTTASIHPDGAHWQIAAIDDPAAALVGEAADLLGPGDRGIAEYVLADLDHRGVLDRDVRAIAGDLAIDVARVERVLAGVRAVGPPGLAASSIRDCLSHQIDALDASAALRGDAQQLVDHLDEVAYRVETRVGATLGLTVDRVRDAMGVLQQIRPGATFAAEPVLPPPPPDLEVIAGHNQALAAEVTRDVEATVSLDPLYVELASGRGPTAARASRADQQHAREWLGRAQGFVTQLERRQSTLEAVATRAVQHQAAFVASGAAHHRPLTRATLAAQLGLHESTVSRAVKDKVLQLPDGRTLPLAAMFGASTSAIEALRDLLAEVGRLPSDDQLANELARRGHRIARRTVTKYRHALGVPAAKRTSRPRTA
jgi:RNA polymerase sigma-54 factor